MPEFFVLSRADQREALSKAYGVIRRFSEDVDLTYDIRAIARDLIDKAESPLPTSRSQEKKWSKTIRQRLADLVRDQLAPELAATLTEQGLPAKVRAEGERVFIDYEALGQGTGYVQPSVLLEFGARPTGEPNESRSVLCDAAQHVPRKGSDEVRPPRSRACDSCRSPPFRTFSVPARKRHLASPLSACLLYRIW